MDNSWARPLGKHQETLHGSCKAKGQEDEGGISGAGNNNAIEAVSAAFSGGQTAGQLGVSSSLGSDFEGCHARRVYNRVLGSSGPI
jgi:hypothetical protein